MKATARVVDRLLKLALSYPDAWEDHPWDETVVKVRKKIFVFLGIHEQQLMCTVKLPDSRDFALSFDWTEPTGYGLGRAGWVSAHFPLRDDVPVDRGGRTTTRQLGNVTGHGCPFHSRIRCRATAAGCGR